MAFVPKYCWILNAETFVGLRTGVQEFCQLCRRIWFDVLSVNWLLHSLLKVTVYILGIEARESFVSQRSRSLEPLFFN